MPRDLATAQNELDGARATLATLQELVREGADDVTPQQLADQRELIAFAELRVEAAQRTETRFREDERAALAAAAKEAALELIEGSGMDEIGAATRAAVDALAHLAALAYERNALIAEVGATLTRLDDDLSTATDVQPPGGSFGSRRYGVWGDRARVAVEGVGFAARLNVGRISTAVVVAGLGGTPEGREAQAQHMNEFNGLRRMAIRNLLEAHPQLQEQLRVTPEEFEAADQQERSSLSEQGRRPVAQEASAA